MEYERAGIAAICVEDNLFPKRNSLYLGDSKRELIPLEEQARRIAAAKAAQRTDDFTFIARVEALIAGHGVEDACRRADAYAEAGADAILIHSRDKTLGEIEGFLGAWQGLGEVPLVAVPTLFPDFTAEELHDKGFDMVILANQPMRAAVRAIEETLETLQRERKAAAVDPDIAPVDHIFDLVRHQGDDRAGGKRRVTGLPLIASHDGRGGGRRTAASSGGGVSADGSGPGGRRRRARLHHRPADGAHPRRPGHPRRRRGRRSGGTSPAARARASGSSSPTSRATS